jgi:hypothetical protein
LNALKLHHDLKARGVNLEAADNALLVDAPAGVLTEEDRAALMECKPVLLRFLSRTQQEPEDDGRRFDARPSRHPGYTSLYDPVEGRWHDFHTKDCYPSIVTLASRHRKGGAA